MEKIQMNVERFKKVDKKLCATEWQEFAKKTIEDFNIGKPFDKIIFKYAKNNLTFLRGKVLNLKESASYKGDDLKSYNKLLIWSLKKYVK